MKNPIHLDARITAFVEQKMRSWGRLQETAARAANRQDAGQSTLQNKRSAPIRPGH